MPALIQDNGPVVDPDPAIAVVGLDLKFPGDATSPEAFFDMLLQGRSALTDIPKDRYNIDAFYHPDPDRAGAVRFFKTAPLVCQIANSCADKHQKSSFHNRQSCRLRCAFLFHHSC